LLEQTASISKLWASLKNIAVQSRLTTYSDRQKSGDTKTTIKNREYSENP
jgi:hypothetical protein